MKTKPNDYAFATSSPSCDSAPAYTQEGMTKLEYASIMAMQGILANPFYAERFAANNGAPCVPDLAKMAIEQAQALINELNEVEA